MSTTATPATPAPKFNLTTLGKAARQNPSRIPELAREARDAARRVPGAPSNATPHRAVPLNPAASYYGPAAPAAEAAPAPEPRPAPRPLETIARPAVDVALAAEVVRAVATIFGARNDAFEHRETARQAFEHLLATPVAEDDNARVYVSPQAERMLSTFSGAAGVSATAASLATRLALLLHADRHGPGTRPLDVDVLDDAMRAALWYQRATAPAPVPASPTSEDFPGDLEDVLADEAEEVNLPHTPAPAAAAVIETGDVPNAPAPDAEQPPRPAAGELDARWQRLLALVHASNGRLTLRQAHRAGFTAAEIATLTGAHPGVLTTAVTAPAGKGGRPSKLLTANPAP